MGDRMGIIDKFIDLEKNKNLPKDNTSSEVMTKKQSKQNDNFIRTLGDVRVAAEAQRIFNPAIPPMPPKPPSTTMIDRGTSGAMDTTGTWGRPEKITR